MKIRRKKNRKCKNNGILFGTMNSEVGRWDVDFIVSLFIVRVSEVVADFNRSQQRICRLHHGWTRQRIYRVHYTIVFSSRQPFVDFRLYELDKWFAEFHLKFHTRNRYLFNHNEQWIANFTLSELSNGCRVHQKFCTTFCWHGN